MSGAQTGTLSTHHSLTLFLCTLSHILHHATVQTQVWSSSKEVLCRRLGAQTGTSLWQHAHGIDDRPVAPPKARKSVGADVNWGVRFSNAQEADVFLKVGRAVHGGFYNTLELHVLVVVFLCLPVRVVFRWHAPRLSVASSTLGLTILPSFPAVCTHNLISKQQELCAEVASRLSAANTRARSITLKLKRKQQGAPEPAKFLGHGACDNMSRRCGKMAGLGLGV